MKTDISIRRLVGDIFDQDFYEKTYSPWFGERSPLDHFLSIGWVQGTDPNADFSTLKYLLRYDDVLFRNLNPIVHYLKIGKEQGRVVEEHTDDDSIYLPWDTRAAELLPLWFDEEYYLELNPDLVGSRNLLSQFLVLGWAQGRDPCARFSTHKYLWKYSDVAQSGVNPLVHFLSVGLTEGRQALSAEGSRRTVSRQLSDAEWLELVRAEFDPTFYQNMYPSIEGFSDLFQHYRTTGWLEGKDPSSQFSNRLYLAKHQDVRATGLEPLFHYIRFGVFEGRATFPSEAVAETPEENGSAELIDDEEPILRSEFDEAYYLKTYPELSTVADPYRHFMSVGWREGKNPSNTFDTKFYLEREGDIREARINPFRHYVLHGRAEGRIGLSRLPTRAGMTKYPLLSIIVPNYNHSRFLPERLRSITAQNYPTVELILLDDASSDESQKVITEFAQVYEGRCSVVINEKNSGNVFSQWKRGIDLSSGDLIWICESDDTCDDHFLEETIYLFQDPSIQLVFGDIQFIDTEGRHVDGMTGFREASEPGIWSTVKVMPAAKWFSGPLGITNLIANVGGCVFRKPSFGTDTWSSISTFKVAGDWLLYVLAVGGGQIAYAPGAKAFFRQHGANTSVKAFQSPSFYDELSRFHRFLRSRWHLSATTTIKFFEKVESTFKLSLLSTDKNLTSFMSVDTLLSAPKKQKHIAISFLNFNVGGGEIFPIELLNTLHKRGHLVSAVVQNLDADNDFVRQWLHPNIPVYSADKNSRNGYQLAMDAGFDIIHSHNLWSEFFFLKGGHHNSFRYVVTLHGSYEVSHVRREQIEEFFGKVCWVYTADRNLEKFQAFRLPTDDFTLIPNGMTRRLSPKPVARKYLGIPENAKVFLFAARSHPEKGWSQAAAAFERMQATVKTDTYLIMVGEGDEADKARALSGENASLIFLGFRSDLDDLLEIADFTVLPSRFSGESMPLFLIQSIMAHVPVISTDIGRIVEMLSTPHGLAGVTIEANHDDDIFIARLSAEMKNAAEGRLHVPEGVFTFASERYSIETCADKYELLYGLTSLSGQQLP